MAAILADNNFKCIFYNENYRIPIQISLKFAPSNATENIIALRLRGNKPLPEPMLTQFTHTYMWHLREMS